MKSYIKWILITLIVVYVISPRDICLGPIDDMLLILLMVAAYRRHRFLSRRDEDKEIETHTYPGRDFGGSYGNGYGREYDYEYRNGSDANSGYDYVADSDHIEVIDVDGRKIN